MNKIENIVAKVKIANYEQFLHLQQCFRKMCLQQRHQKASKCETGFTVILINIKHPVVKAELWKPYLNESRMIDLC